jgi:hypothetical protein
VTEDEEGFERFVAGNPLLRDELEDDEGILVAPNQIIDGEYVKEGDEEGNEETAIQPPALTPEHTRAREYVAKVFSFRYLHFDCL